MSPPIRIWGAFRALALRPRLSVPRIEPWTCSTRIRRFADDAARRPPTDTIQDAPDGIDPTLAHLDASRSRDGGSASENLQTTSGDPNTIDNEMDDSGAVLLEAALNRGEISGSQGGLTPEQEEALYNEGRIPPATDNQKAIEDLEVLAAGGDIGFGDGLRFPAPGRLPPHSHLKSRYHPVLEQLTRLLMRHGKLSVAQRNMAMILNFLRTSPPPIINARYPLLPGAPPPAYLPLNPILYLTIVIDSVAPLIYIRRIKGGAGGGMALEVPQPLAVRQRRRQAFLWILDVVAKKPSMGSGRTQLAHRIASEIIAVAEGRSSVWEKRQMIHKLGTAARANIAGARPKRKKRS